MARFYKVPNYKVNLVLLTSLVLVILNSISATFFYPNPNRSLNPHLCLVQLSNTVFAQCGSPSCLIHSLFFLNIGFKMLIIPISVLVFLSFVQSFSA